MSDLLREIDEDLRKERMMGLVRRYGPYILVVAVLIVAVVGGWEGWRSYQASQRDDRSEAYAAALAELEAGREEAALAAFGVLASPSGGDYALLAGFEAARLKAEAGDIEGAVEDWRELASSSSAPRGLRAIATLYAVMYRMDEGDPRALQGELEELTGEGEPMRVAALELQALLAQKAGEGEQALDLYRRISDDPAAPSTARQRAAQVLDALEG